MSESRIEFLRRVGAMKGPAVVSELDDYKTLAEQGFQVILLAESNSIFDQKFACAVWLLVGVLAALNFVRTLESSKG